MEPFSASTLTLATISCSLLAVRAVRNQSLTVPGAVVGFATGFLMVATGLRGFGLFFFYQFGSWATKYKRHVKAHADATVATHAQRGATQVLCVSLLACVLSLTHALYYGAERPVQFSNHHAKDASSHITCAILAHHATGLADTLASELGSLARTYHGIPDWMRRTVLVTQPWRTVPPGTNGGVTVWGTGWSLVGGATMGVVHVMLDASSGLRPTSYYALRLMVYATVTGGVGSVVDSILGATLQVTYYDVDTHLVYHGHMPRPATARRVCGIDVLSNEHVNFVSTAVTVGLGGWILAPLFLE